MVGYRHFARFFRTYVQFSFSKSTVVAPAIVFALSLSLAAPVPAQNPAASPNAPHASQSSDKNQAPAPSRANSQPVANSAAPQPVPHAAATPNEGGGDLQSLPLARTVTDRNGAAEMPAELSSFYSFDSNRQQAAAANSQSAPVPIERDRAATSPAQISAGAVHSSTETQQKTRELNLQAPKVSTENSNPGPPGDSSSTQGEDYTEFGQMIKGVVTFEKAQSPARTPGSASARATAPKITGASYSPRAEKRAASDAENEAEAAQPTAIDHAAQTRSLITVARSFSQLGSEEKARDVLNTALTVATESGDSVGMASAQNSLGAVYSNLGDQVKALELANRAMPVIRDIHDPVMLAGALNNRGITLARTGKRDDALKDFQEALTNAHNSGDRTDEAIALSNIGKIYEDEGQNPQAVDNYTRALTIYESLHDPLGEADTMFLLFDYWRVQRNPSLAIFFGKEAIDRYQAVRLQLAGLEKQDKDSFVHSKEQYYREIAGVLISEGRYVEAEEVLDLLKVEEYTEFSQRRGILQPSTHLLAMTATESAVDVEISKSDEEIAAIGRQWSELKEKPARTPEEDAKLTALSTQLTAANQRYEDFLKGIYSRFGKGNQGNRNMETVEEDIGGLQNIEADLGSDTAAVYTLVLDDRVDMIVITPATKHPHEISIKRDDLRGDVFSFVNALAHHASSDSVLAKSQALYKELIAPVDEDLRGANAHTVLWSLDDVLRYLPISALYDGKQFLVERYQNIVITTASIGNLEDQPHIANWRGVAMGVSKNYFNLGELKAVPSELDSVVSESDLPASHGPVPGTILLDDSFTQKQMEAALDRHSPLIHVASHFIFQAGDDTKSYLLLGGKDTGGAGYKLTLADLRDDQNLDFHGVELLTVAGCDTALGSNDSDGREIDGLGIVAQRKGAKAVVATLWAVDDASVGVLMAQFYKLWMTTPGITKAEALRQAQISLLRGTLPATAANAASAPSAGSDAAPYSNPYYWAPFILIGNWK
jgi:CHAT domain-containing protein/tetratricopeptide (TPR) repeat protein